MRLPQPKESAKSPSNIHASLQTLSAVVVAAATAYAYFQLQSHPKSFVWLVAVVTLFVVAMMIPPFKRLLVFVQNRKIRKIRDKAAKAEYFELMTRAKRFAPFTNSDHPNNIWHIVHSADNNFEKADRVCPTDYMKDLFPLFLKNMERHPPKNETEFLAAIDELCGLVASYNRFYVSESLRRMREPRWKMPPKVDSDFGHVIPANPPLGAWLASMPPHYHEPVGRQIEDFRERWAGFLDDMTIWLTRVNDVFDVRLSTYFERPQKL